jgi:predicted ATPase
MPFVYAAIRNWDELNKFDDSDNRIILRQTPWDDFGYGTTYEVVALRSTGWSIAGVTKIARRGMRAIDDNRTTLYTQLPPAFDSLGDEYVSVGQDASLYVNLVSWFGATGAMRLLVALRDMAAMPALISMHLDDDVTQLSLLRTISARTVRDQYRRILEGGNKQQAFSLKYKLRPGYDEGPIMTFSATPSSALPTNVHVIIGANGTGKTTTFRNMLRELQVLPADTNAPRQLEMSDNTSISSCVSVSFSAFDAPRVFARDRNAETQFPVKHIGLRAAPSHAHGRNATSTQFMPRAPQHSEVGSQATDTNHVPRSHEDTFREAVEDCQKNREQRLITALSFLADADSVLDSRGIRNPGELKRVSFSGLSSGHQIVLLTIVNLVRYCEEKCLVLIDEPESHLHPPLVSAFTRAVSWLMAEINGLAILATHSPVVLQEVPSQCVWKIWSTGTRSNVSRPNTETFGENLGILTRDVFGLELDKSGYHAILEKMANSFDSYEAALRSVDDQLGNEARLILRTMMSQRKFT